MCTYISWRPCSLLLILYSLYRCLGVWDTVGALGLPEELTPLSKKVVQLFGFQDRFLGYHIEAAYQALALNEMRVDFVSTNVPFCKTLH